MAKIKLVLRGGGTRPGVYVGALKVLEREGIEVEEALGTSLGSLMAGGIGSGRDAESLHRLARDLTPKKLMDFRIFSTWPFVDGTKGFIKGDKILRALEDSMPKDYDHTTIPVHIAAHNWTQGENRVFTKGHLPLHQRASMALPVFDMVEINGDFYEDGGVSGNFLLDYQGWKLKNDTPVIGFSLTSTLPRSTRRAKPKNKFARWAATIDDMIVANDREHIEDAHWAKVVTLPTKHSGFNFGLDEEGVDDQVREGTKGMEAGLKKLEGILG